MQDLLDDRVKAMTWLQRQRSNLLSCVSALARESQHQPLLKLADAMSVYLRQAGPWEHALILHREAADCAARHGDRIGYARSLCELGGILYLRSEYPQAEAALREALAVVRQCATERAATSLESTALVRLGALQRHTGQLADAVEKYSMCFGGATPPRGQRG